MYIVLDTSVVIDIEKGIEQTKQRLLSVKSEGNFLPAITSITYTELLHGYLKIGKSRKEVDSVLDKYFLLNTSKDSSKIAAEFMHYLEVKGKMIPTADILIASISADKNSVFVTKDNHFKNIPNLRCVFI